MKVFNALAVLAVLAVLSQSTISQEGGMIPYDSAPGEIGGQGHWYALRTLKAEEYYADRPIMSDIRENEDGSYSVSGEPPINVTLVVDTNFSTEYRWRKALNWLREAEQMFRNSGVPLRFVVVRIVDVTGPDTMEERLNWLDDRPYREDSDLVLYLALHYMFDPACGVTYLYSTLSVSGCSSKVLAHEIGHQFGLLHAHDQREGPKGFCMDGNDTAEEDCSKGTIMSYSYNKVPLFANRLFKYNERPLGDEDQDAVEHLNKVKTEIALRAELRKENNNRFESDLIRDLQICYLPK